MTAQLAEIAMTGKGFFVNGGSQPLIAAFHDHASNSYWEVRTSVVVNGGAMDASTGISTVKLTFPYGDKPTTFTLGQDIYSVRFELSPFVWNPDRLQLIGSVNADVSVSPTPTIPTPEPSILALIGTGLATVAGAAWRRRRRAAAGLSS
jgi:hypothetical protein